MSNYAFTFTKTVSVMLFFILALILFCSIFSDIYAPYTTQSQVQMPSINVHPQVSGDVVQLYVKNGERVKKGTALFSINNNQYQIYVYAAKAKLYQAIANLTQLHAQLKTELATLQQQKDLYNLSLINFKRYAKLLKTKQISVQEFDDAKSNKQSNYFLLQSKYATIDMIKAKIGPENKNPSVLSAKATLENAELNLSHCVVRSGVDGTVTNLQINLGDYASPNNTTLIITDVSNTYLTANFNEKGLPRIHKATKVFIVFDAYPGQMFSGVVTSVDRAIEGGVSEEGTLAQTNNSSRWIRKTQVFQARIHINNAPKLLISGSRATVMMNDTDSIFWSVFAKCIMYFISVFRYVY